MNFKQWIKQLESEDNPLGDLANDISSDADFPESNDYEQMKSHLERKCSNAAREKVLGAFEEAYSLYKQAH